MFKGDKTKQLKDDPDRLNILVEGTHMTGDLVTKSSIRVEGLIDGSIDCKGKIVLGEAGVVTGNINTIEIEVYGTVEGNIHAESLLTLRKSAVIKGDIKTSRLVIEDGAQIEGNILTGDFPNDALVQNAKPSKKNKKTEKSDKTASKKQEDLVY
ncbi:hypothetical protein CW751_04840 [Brumimicrobium salinarum]|uniref:Polymer-forming cytoskeletal protein n=1 Tax=Brumimicrobium salinarum TaxID=2058658 RepID=A0A2I0R479_9FLAO|nr:polymer-forming cytoskeletal protein [Brumimicrobium salinarum]PKR81386.1 hypothetical protein CW751_04840 [Brumimicrobium salinarum]